MTTLDKRFLEKLIDSNSLNQVLQGIAEICHEKSSHITENWQDKLLAKIWTRNANAVEKAASKVKEKVN